MRKKLYFEVAVENYSAPFPSFFQDLSVWEFITGMLSCEKKNAAMWPKGKQKKTHFSILPARLFLKSTSIAVLM